MQKMGLPTMLINSYGDMESEVGERREGWDVGEAVLVLYPLVGGRRGGGGESDVWLPW